MGEVTEMQLAMFENIGLLAYMIATWTLALVVAAGLDTYLLNHWVTSPDDLKDRYLAIHLSFLTADGLGFALLLHSIRVFGPAGSVTLLDLGVGVSVLVGSTWLITNIMGMRKFTMRHGQNLQTNS